MLDPEEDQDRRPPLCQNGPDRKQFEIPEQENSSQGQEE
jgi:hypothetical protein